jgi:hypothetical protein
MVMPITGEPILTTPNPTSNFTSNRKFDSSSGAAIETPPTATEKVLLKHAMHAVA